MADLKISELNALTGSDVVAADLLAVVHSGETKKLTIKDLIENGVTTIADDKIPGAKLLFNGDDDRLPTAGIADDAITTAKIADDNVTEAKIADNAVLQVYTGSTNRTDAKFTGKLALDTTDNKLYIWSGNAWVDLAASTSISSVTGSDTGVVNITATTTSGAVTITASVDNSTAAKQFLAGPTGAAGAVALREIVGSDLPVATTSAKGAVIVNGEGLRMDGDTIEVDNDVTASATTHHVVTYNAKGQITGGRVLAASDLPAATSSAKGAVIPGTGLEVDGSGNLNHTNSATAGTFTKVTIDGQGHASSGTTLEADDIPDIPAGKITSGTIPTDRIGTDAVTGPKLADQSTCKFGGAGATDNVVVFPDGDYKGQLFFDEKNEDLYIYTSESYLPITVISGNLVNAGTYNANTNLVSSVTSAGSAAGFTANAALPDPAAGNLNYYVVVDTSGTGSGNAPAEQLAPPDMLISLGAAQTTFQLVDVSNAIAGQTAANISVVATGNIAATDVQAALQELDTEKIGAASPTFTGTVLLGQNAVLAFEGSSDDDSETTITVTNPTADRQIVFPDVSGNVVTTGDTGTVTSAMIANTTIVDGDISASAEIAVSKLANGSARQLLQTASNGTDVEFTSDVDVPGTLDVTGVATFDSTSTFAGVATFNANIVMEGTSADDHELTLTCNPTSDVTVTLPDATTTVAGLAVAQSFTKAQRGTPVALTDGTVALDLSLGNNFTLLLEEDSTISAPTNATAGQSGVIVVTQDGTGGRTLGYHTNIKFAGGTVPTVTATANAVSVLAYYVESSSRITMTAVLDTKRT
jgi:hypothetical protein